MSEKGGTAINTTVVQAIKNGEGVLKQYFMVAYIYKLSSCVLLHDYTCRGNN